MNHPFMVFSAGAVSLFSLPCNAREFPTPHDSEPGNVQPPSPLESLAMWRLPDGFGISLFAAEPDVQNPISMTWDHRGRLWVAENYTYAETSKRFDLELRDRLLIFEDGDHDGKAEIRTVFADDFQMLTSVEVGRGGVWLMCPPNLLFVADADGDDVPDGPPQIVLDGFTVAKANYHNFANGLRWGPDGWLYGRCGHSCPGNIGVPGTPDDERVPIKGGIWRYHPARKVVEVLLHGTTNPWGHDWDRHGEAFFTNTVTGHLWHSIPGAHFKESFGESMAKGVYRRMDMCADHWHFDTKGKWQDSRDGKANDFGGGHAHIGAMIYQADQWPEIYRDKLFTLNMHGRRANMERLEREGSGYVGKHEPDVFFCDDPWFRGIDLSVGPDGSAYVLDWSDTGECHDHTGVHRNSGRIYRISYGDTIPPDLTTLEDMTAENVGRLLRHPNDWFARQARIRLMSEGAGQGVVDSLAEIAGNPAGATVHRLRALWALAALDANQSGQLIRLLEDGNEHLRVWALRLLTDTWALDTLRGPSPRQTPAIEQAVEEKLVKLAAGDPSGLVKLALASILQRLPVEKRAAVARELVRDRRFAEDPNLPLMVWYGLIPVGESNAADLVRVASVCQWPETVKWIARNLATRIEEEPEPVDDLLELMPERDGGFRLSVLKGIREGLEGSRRARMPATWQAVVSALPKGAGPEVDRLVQELGLLFGDDRAMNELRQIVRNEAAPIAAREAALESLMEARPADLRQIAEPLLEVKGLAGAAARGLGVYEDAEIAVLLVERFAGMSPADQQAAIEVLSSRPTWALVFLDAMAGGKIEKSHLSAFSARQIRSLGDEKVSMRLREVWGTLKDTPAGKKAELVKLKQRLTREVLEKGNLKKGRALYESHCGSCHVLYGTGGRIGPDLTGGGRHDLDYLLENIVDPGAVVSADYQVTLFTLEDGRVLSGAVAARTEKSLTLRQPAGDLVVEAGRVVKEEALDVSLMPEGLLSQLDEARIRDLIAYLMHPHQVAP